MVEAWQSNAYRVPKQKFERLLKSDRALEPIGPTIDAKNFILDFQHALTDINKEGLSHLLQSVIDENQLVKIVPKDLESFFRVCFLLDNLGKTPDNAGIWPVYFLSWVQPNSWLEDVSKIV